MDYNIKISSTTPLHGFVPLWVSSGGKAEPVYRMPTQHLFSILRVLAKENESYLRNLSRLQGGGPSSEDALYKKCLEMPSFLTIFDELERRDNEGEIHSIIEEAHQMTQVELSTGVKEQNPLDIIEDLKKAGVELK